MNMPTWPVQDAKARFSELLDTNVVSELRKPKPHGAVLASLRTALPQTIQFQKCLTTSKPCFF